MAPRGEASHEGGELSTSRFAGSIEISLNDNSLETEEDVAAIAAQLAAAGFDEIDHSSGVAILPFVPRIASNLRGSLRPTASASRHPRSRQISRVLPSSGPMTSRTSPQSRRSRVPARLHIAVIIYPAQQEARTNDVIRTAELVASGVCDISGPPPRVSTSGLSRTFAETRSPLDFHRPARRRHRPLRRRRFWNGPHEHAAARHSSPSTAPTILRSLAPPHQHSLHEGRQAPRNQPSTGLTGPSINDTSLASRHGATQLQFKFPALPQPKTRVQTIRTISCWGGLLQCSLPVAAPPVTVSCPSRPSVCHRLWANASCWASPPGHRPWGGLGEGGAAPDLAAEAPAETATQEAEATAEATTRGAEATAEAAAHKANEPAQASARTESEAPVTAAQAKAPAAAATRQPWWNLVRICYISAVAVSCTVEDPSLAFVFERDTSSRTAGALLTSARDACDPRLPLDAPCRRLRRSRALRQRLHHQRRRRRRHSRVLESRFR